MQIEANLLGQVTLVQHWGAIGTEGRRFAKVYPDRKAAQKALVRLAAQRRKQGYRDRVG